MSASKRNANHSNNSPDRVRRISHHQHPKDTPVTQPPSKTDARQTSPQHSHHTVERTRRISQHSNPHPEHDHHPEKTRRIGHHSRDQGPASKDHPSKGRSHAGSRGRAGTLTQRDHDRHSVATSSDLNQAVEYENTYKLEPDHVFHPEKVKVIIKDVLQENLKGQQYDKELMGKRCLVISDILKEKVRQLNLNRFKIVSVVLIGEKKDQSLLVSSRCLWNHACDNFASCMYSKGNLCAVGMVFAVYQE